MVKNRSGNEGSLTDPDVQNLARIAVAATEYQQQILDLFPRISDDLRNIRETQLRQHTELQSAIQRLEHHTQVQLDNAFQQLELSRKQHNEEVARLMEIIKLHVPSAGLSSAGNALNFQQSRLAQGVDPRAYLSPQVYQALQAQQLQQNLLQQGIANLGISSQPVPVSQQAPPVAQPLSSGLAPNITFPKPVTSEPPIVSAAPTTPITAAPSVFASPQKEIKKEPSVPTGTGFGEKFKLQAGEWNCAGCYAKNSGDSCLCCGTKKDGGAQVEKSIFSQPKPVSKPSGNVSFGFGSSASTATVTTTTATSVTSSAPSQTATVTTASNTTVPATTTGTPKFSFGQPLFGKSSEKTATSASTFSFKPKEGSASPQTNASPAFGAGAASGSIFGGGLSSASSLLSNAGKGGGSIFANTDKEQNPFAKLSTAKPFASLKTPSKDEGEDGDNDNVEEYEPDVHFNPVIPLPALVEVVTGEEGEKEVFKHRCKLFRFDKETKENKERGVGDIKILLDEEKNAYRVVMRREQVHKLCANFRISKGLKLSPKANMPNVYTVVCTDFSEDPVNGTHEVLTIKFKTDEIAKQFAEVFDKAAGGETTA